MYMENVDEHMILREQVHSLETEVADLVNLRQRERFREESLRDLQNNPTSVLSALVESLEEGGLQCEEEGWDLLEGTLPRVKDW